MGDKITLNQAMEIADKMEEATQKVLDKGIEGDSYKMTEYNDILELIDLLEHYLKWFIPSPFCFQRLNA